MISVSLDGLEKDLLEYRGAIDFISSMLALDFQSAISFAQPFDNHYNRMIGTVDQVVGAVLASVEAKSRVAVEKAESDVIAFSLFSVAALSVSAFLAWVVIYSALKSIKDIASVTMVLANGDLDVDLDRVASNDETGAIVRSLHIFRENILESNRLKEQREELERSIEREKLSTMADLAKRFDDQIGGAIGSLAVSAEGLLGAARNMENTAQDTENASRVVSSASEETRTNLSVVSVATGQLKSTALELARQVTDVALRASKAASGAD